MPYAARTLCGAASASEALREHRFDDRRHRYQHDDDNEHRFIQQTVSGEIRFCVSHCFRSFGQFIRRNGHSRPTAGTYLTNTAKYRICGGNVVIGE